MLKLSAHHHTGCLRPHEHTSYLPLALLLLLTGGLLAFFTAGMAGAATPYDGPEAGSIGLTGTVPGKPPTTAATITIPSNGQRFSTSPVTVSGTCPENTLVEIFKNNIFAGSTVCTSKGEYSLDVDLLLGENILFARVYDALNQPGPDSNSVTVYYDALPPQSDPLTSVFFSSNQLLLNTDAVFRGIFPGKQLTMPLDVIGGTPPYALNVQWGDGKNDVTSRANNTSFKMTHTYERPGVYQITVQASDSQNRVAFLTVAAIVNGQPPISSASTSLDDQERTLLMELLLLWPFYVALVTAVVSFWLGEQREKHLLLRHNIIAAR